MEERVPWTQHPCYPGGLPTALPPPCPALRGPAWLPQASGPCCHPARPWWGSCSTCCCPEWSSCWCCCPRPLWSTWDSCATLGSTRLPAPAAERCSPTAAPRRSSCSASSRCRRFSFWRRLPAPACSGDSAHCCLSPPGPQDPAGAGGPAKGAAPMRRISSVRGCDSLGPPRAESSHARGIGPGVPPARRRRRAPHAVLGVAWRWRASRIAPTSSRMETGKDPKGRDGRSSAGLRATRGSAPSQRTRSPSQAVVVQPLANIPETVSPAGLLLGGAAPSGLGSGSLRTAGTWSVQRSKGGGAGSALLPRVPARPAPPHARGRAARAGRRRRGGVARPGGRGEEGRGLREVGRPCPAAGGLAGGEQQAESPPRRAMLFWTALSLALSLRPVRSGAERGERDGSRAPAPGGPSTAGLPAAAPQGDVLFLLDSSASVSHYEFSRVREFVGQLVAPLPLSPGTLRASLVHVGSRPHTEFPFDQYSSGQAVQDAIRATAQRMGDTNTGLALAYAKEQLFAEAAGARPGVPKVLVWVTDGGSSEPVAPPMQELKDLGVTVFIVSTGRGSWLELSAAASAPAEKHLHFVDVDDLPIIAPELRGSILDAMQPQQLYASEVLPTSFRLSWPSLLTADSGYYVLELMPSNQPGAARRQQLPGNATSWTWTGLDSDTDYDVVLLPESNVHLPRPQHLRVRTLPEEVGPERIVISHVRPRSLRVSWAPSLGPASTLGYYVQLVPLGGGAVQHTEVPAGSNSTTFQGLASGTVYLVTVTAAFRSGRERALSAKACTPDGERTRAPRGTKATLDAEGRGP